MTLAELDALIDAKPGAVAILLGEPEWRELMKDPAGAPWRTIAADGQVAYRGITVWVAYPGRVRVLDAVEAVTEGAV